MPFTVYILVERGWAMLTNIITDNTIKNIVPENTTKSTSTFAMNIRLEARDVARRNTFDNNRCRKYSTNSWRVTYSTNRCPPLKILSQRMLQAILVCRQT